MKSGSETSIDLETPQNSSIFNPESPLFRLPEETLCHILKFISLIDNPEPFLINHAFYRSSHTVIKQQMNALAQSRGITDPLSSEEGYKAFWQSQQEEMDYLLRHKNEVLMKTQRDLAVQTAYKKLETPSTMVGMADLYSRERNLNSLNEAIIRSIISLAKNRQKSMINYQLGFDGNEHFLTRFPASIIDDPDLTSYWTSIKRFSIQFNKISKLPENIAKLTALENLNLGYNQLTILPTGIWQLTKLEILSVTGNKITILPEEIGQLTALNIFSASSNQLKMLPSNICLLTKLTTLNLSGNKLAELPENIDLLHNLKHLMVDSNELNFLPSSICKLDKLEWLSIVHNCLSELPDSLREDTLRYSSGSKETKTHVLSLQKPKRIANEDSHEEKKISVRL